MTRAVSCLGLSLLVTVIAFSLPAAAEEYSVGSNTYSRTATLVDSDPYDSHELAKPNGKQVTYSMTVTSGSCAALLFVKGHNVNPDSQYFVVYSKEDCVSSYSNSFSSDNEGTQFSVVVVATGSTPVTYSLAITIADVPITNYLLGGAICLGIIVVLVVVAVVRSRRKRALAQQMPPVAPGGYPGYGQQTAYVQPGYPQSQPPPPAYPPRPPAPPPPPPPPPP